MDKRVTQLLIGLAVVLCHGVTVCCAQSNNSEHWEPIATGTPLLERLPPVEETLTLDSTTLPTVQGNDWWSQLVVQPQRPGTQSLPLTLDQLAIETLRHSQQVQALRVGPQISRTLVTQADATFDPVAFVDAKWFDRDEPVGSFLTTGGVPRLLEDTFTENIGVRRKTRSGASVEVAQRLGYQNSNSTFFIPNDQAQTRLSVSVTQPLLRGAGRAFNEAVIVQAEYDVRIASDVFAAGLQDQLLRVAEQYWQLYFQRALVLQQGRNLQRARAILNHLENRQAIDVLRSQIQRAKAKVATREASWLRASASVRDAEATLRSLVNSPLLLSHPNVELAPLDIPREDHVEISAIVARQLALAQRPEIDSLMAQMRIAAVETDVAANQVLPSLALVVESYVNGLQGDAQLGRALGDQFAEGAPSYTAGLFFEMPLGNRRAKSQLFQRQLELSRVSHQLDASMAEISAEVEIVLREVYVAHALLESRRAALAATAAEVDYLYQRWKQLPGHDQSTSLFLVDLLDAEDRLVNEEQLLVGAQTSFAVAQVKLKRALGELIVFDPCVQCSTR